LKICLLLCRGNMFCGGQGIYLYYLSRELQRLGHDVHVMVGPPYPDIAPGITVHKIDNLRLYESGGDFLPYPHPLRIFTPLNFYEFAATRFGAFPEMLTFSVRAFQRLKTLLREHRFDVIHDNQTMGYGLLLMKSFGIPLIGTVHHPLPIDREAALRQALGAHQMIRLIFFYPFIMPNIVSKRMDRVITISESSGREIARYFKVPAQKTRVVYLGVDTKAFRPNGRTAEKGHILFVGNTDDRRKGIIYLLKAMELLSKDYDLHLTIVDRKPPESVLAPIFVERYKLEDRVTFTGRLSTEDLAALYSTATIAVTPSLFEGFGLPAVEAMACGVPVIASRAGALPEVVVDGETGILVPPADPPALAGAIARLVDQPTLREKFGFAGRERVERLFTWEQVAKKTVEVYKEVL